MLAIRRPLRVFITLLAVVMLLGSVLPVTVSSPAGGIASPISNVAAQQAPFISHAVDTLPKPLAAPATADAPLVAEPAITEPPIELEQEQQGDITLAISVTELFRAGDLITYTYRFENTSSEVQRDVRIETTYTGFGTTRNGRDLFIFCEEITDVPDTLIPCQIAPDSLQTSQPFSVSFEVAKVGSLPTGLRLRIPELPAGATGAFQYVLETAYLRYPVSGGTRQTIGNTGNIFVGDTLITNVNRETAPSGPLFTISKSVNESPSIGRTPPAIFAGEEVTYDLVVSNAPLETDQARPDAIEATNLSIRDVVPNGAEFITPTQVLYPFEYRAQEGFVLWELPRLRVGETITIPVTFRMRDTPTECRNLNNRTLSVTSPQMPIDDLLTPDIEFPNIAIGARAVAVALQTPLVVTSRAEPATIAPGEQSRITFEVANYYLDADVQDIQLVYDIQPEAYYVTNTATMSDALTFIPPDNLPGQRIVWTFDMPRAPSLDSPTRLTFSADITATARANGVVQIVATKDTQPAALPKSCFPAVRSNVNVQVPIDQIVVTKRAALPDEQFQGNVALIEQGQRVRYVIEVENTSESQVQGFELIDQLPQDSQESIDGGQPDGSAEFTFVAGTASPGVSDFSSEGGGTLFWRNITLPPGITTFEYEATVEGLEFYTYCNTAAGSLPDEQAGFDVDNRPGRFCTKINPQITIIKTADVEQALPGQEFRFTINLVNNSSTTHTIGLADRFIEGDFEFLRVDPDRTYGGTPQRTAGENNGGYELHEWDRVALPPGGRLDAAFFARIPGDTCQFRSRPPIYLNEALFIYESERLPGQPYGVVRVPNDDSTVLIQCLNRQLDFSLATLQAAPSLQTTFNYRMDVINRNLNEPANNVTVRQILPLGFGYEGPSASGDMRDRPTERTLPDGRIELTWQIPTISPDTRFRIEYVARAGQTVGPQVSEMRVSMTDPSWRQNCAESRSVTCGTDDDGAEFSTESVNVQALLTASPRLIVPEGCLNVGNSLEYIVSLVNTDSSRAFQDVTVGLTLTLGLNYTGVVTGTDEPTVNVGPNGETILSWSDVSIERPGTGRQTQRDFRIRLQVGDVLGQLLTRVDVRTPDGLVPIRQGEVNPDVEVCDAIVTNLTLLKEINPRRVAPGGSFVYLITLANRNDFAVNATVREQLPTAFTFAEVLTDSMVTDNPSINGGVLEWRNVPVPASDGNTPGVTEIRFRVRVDQNAELNTYSSSTEVSRIFPSEVPIPDPVSGPTVRVAFENLTYLPLIQRR